MRRRTVARNGRLLRGTAALIAVLSTALAGCGAGSTAVPLETGSESNLRKVRVGIIPIIDVAPLYLGMKKGYFADQGIEVVPVQADGGARIAEAVMSGEVDIGFAAVVPLMVMREAGQPVRAIAAGSSSTGVPDADVNAVVVRKDSPIRRPRDLEGRTVAVNAPNNIGDVTIRTAVDKDGGDPFAVKFVPIPFPEMPGALKDGTVDAMWNTEPFVTASTASGGRVLFNNLTETYPKVQIAVWFTSEPNLKTNRELYKDFVDAMDDSLAYTRDHQLEARTTLLTYTKIPLELVQTANLPDWPTGLDADSARAIGSAARKYGVLKKAADVNGLYGLA